MISVSVASGLLNAAPAHAGEDVTICFERWVPYYDRLSEETAHGPVIDRVTAAFAAEGLSITYRHMPHARCLAAVQGGDVDGMLGASGLDQNMVRVDSPIAVWRLSAVVGASSPLQHAETLEVFADYQAIVYGQYEYPEPLKSFLQRQRPQLIHDESAPKMPIMLLEKRPRTVLFVDAAWAHKMVREVGNGSRVLEPEVATDPVYLALRTGHEDLARRLTARMKADTPEGH